MAVKKKKKVKKVVSKTKKKPLKRKLTPKTEEEISYTHLAAMLTEQETRVKELEDLIHTVSRGKYMWEATFDAITNPVMIISADYKIQRANKQAAKASGVDVRNMIGTTCYKTFAGSETPCEGCPLRATLSENRSNYSQLDPFKKNARHYHVNAYPFETLKENNQAVLHYRDVTDEKELYRQLLQSEKMAAIGMLAGGVAHEINNPLGGVLAFAQLVMRDLPSDHAVQPDLKEIEEAALRCKRIVQDLLDFSRQNKEDVMGPVSINDVMQKLFPLIQVQARTSHIEMIYNFAKELPSIRGSFHRLQQVFLNLVTNAFHAMPQGGKLTVKTYDDKIKKEVVAEVIDTGVGINPDYMDKIFDPYFTTKKQGEGTGLGLSITYGIVRDHGGNIEVKNNRDRGVTFTLSFPYVTI